MQPRVKCLLVDDLDENLLALSALLGSDDVELLEAHSGQEALELLLQHDVALALLDVQMPGMDGFELAELMRGAERTRDVPIIFVTAGARDQNRLFKGYDAGAVDFLYKPIDAFILKNKAEVFFKLHRQKQQLAQQLKERSELLRLNEMFVAMLGHDLRNPLSAMIMSATVMQKQAVDEPSRKSADRMLSSGKRMSRMIENMLDLTRARLAGGIPLNRTACELGALVQAALQELHASYPDKTVEVAAEGTLTGEWDPDRLSQVASNLIGNALQHGTGDAPVRVKIDGRDSDSVVLSVTNEGTIPADVLSYLFNPFHGGHRRDEAQPGNEGLGLGLYIVQQIVQAHGGSVVARSGQDGRSLFEVRIPRR